jgi:hypothetical protein
MTKPSHTSGPLSLLNAARSISLVRDGFVETIARCEMESTRPLEETGANARLFAAAYNAFDSAARRLGLNAVEFAERMQDGGIAELFDLLNEAIEEDNIRVAGENLSNFDRCFRARARDIVAKVKGGAA